MTWLQWIMLALLFNYNLRVAGPGEIENGALTAAGPSGIESGAPMVGVCTGTGYTRNRLEYTLTGRVRVVHIENRDNRNRLSLTNGRWTQRNRKWGTNGRWTQRKRKWGTIGRWTWRNRKWSTNSR
ncbi:hypothetical protein CRG98_050042 [Punica granatum]|uniref:Uncharacterized protein n=1 Tax=Punica granatum TaxID=22663 RepID=A0A2I0GU07_PUNGR|nr:hypothetical protein CRG98_050042 [Punica granatum]